MLLRAGQSPFEPRLVTVPDGQETERESSTQLPRWQPREEPRAGHLDRLWPDTNPVRQSSSSRRTADHGSGL